MLRPGTPEVASQGGLADADAMDAWLRAKGKPGDRFRYETHGPNRVGAGATGEGIITADGEPAYKE